MASRALLLVALAGLMVMSGESSAGRINPETEWRQGDNAKLLPTYCQDRLDPKGRWLPWKSYFGKVSIHVHHYCGGLYSEFKARIAPNQRERKQWLQAVVGEMTYVANNCDTSCILYASVHSKLAQAYNQLGRFDEAMKHTMLLNAVPPAPPGADGVPAEKSARPPPS